MTSHYAHPSKSPDRGTWQPLDAHLIGVSQLTGALASRFGAERLGSLTGLLHDLGKYTEPFQRRLLGSGERVDHSTAGAQQVMALAKSSPPKDRIMAELAAFAIAGHHAGLADSQSEASSLADRLRKTVPRLDEVWRGEIAPDATNLTPLGFETRRTKEALAFQLAFLGRMIFSCLVHADRLDSEAFDAKAAARAVDRDWPALPAIVGGLVARLDALLAGKADGSPVNRRRAEVLAAVRAKADLPPGLFTLNVPTGGGKTLASLDFALRHAKAHGLERVVYAIPFTSIIEQTAETFRKAVGGGLVLEHHASIEEASADAEERFRDHAPGNKLKLAMEDWAAPIVVTTNVQLFESLFSHRPSRCRKLQALAKAVIVLDEAQAIPLAVLKPCVAALDELARNYGATILLCTATQPAWHAPQLGLAIDRERHLVDDPGALHAALRRVTLDRRGVMRDAELVAELAEQAQALVIVNSRRHALGLHEAAKKAGIAGLRHLSTRQTAGDRRTILAAVRADLAAERPCVVVSTSLVEAGVDVDFPRVYRAEAGLDQIIQAAGRCNREGRRRPEDSLVVVFEPAEAKPPQALKALAAATARVAARHADLLSLAAVDDYFHEIYWQAAERLDAKAILSSFAADAAARTFQYRAVGERFRLIEETMAPVIVAGSHETWRTLAALEAGQMTPGAAARRLQRLIVQVPPLDRKALIAAGDVTVLDGFGEQFAVLRNDRLYEAETGLRWEHAGRFDAIV